MRLFRAVALLLVLVLASGDGADPAAPLPGTEPAREWSSCIPNLGCVNTTEAWYHAVYRPFNPLPNKRFTIKTTFVLFSRNCSKDGERFSASPASINAAGFNRNVPTTVVVHDFTSSGQTGWVRRLSQALLAREDRNVVAVDWENGALPPYAQAAANARVVALEITALLQALQGSFAVEPGSVHVVGHGLGAHIAGYVGAAVRGLGRITGLDPSGPYFQGMPLDVRLDPGDAAFVDVIHTDAASPARDDPARADGQGIDDILGHIDFYPNGGRDQPGCSAAGERNLLAVTRDSLPGGSILRGCSHKRAFKYYIESLAAAAGGCQFLAFQCADYATFLQGKCESCGLRGAKCSVMGDKARHFPPTIPGRFYVQTANATPFCDYVYRVNLELAKPPQAKAQVSGWMVLSLVGKAGPPIAMPLESKVVLKHGSTQQMLAFHGEPYVSPVAKAQLTWRYQTHLLHPGTVCFGCDDSLYVSKVVVTSLPAMPHLNETTVTLCSCDGADTARVKSNSSHVFVPCSQDALPKWQKLTTLQH